MPDPLGLIPNSGGIGSPFPRSATPARENGGADFKEALLQEIDKVNQLQKSADRAIEAYATGDRDDIEGVMLATLEADAAFRMLLQVRNKVMEAYEEVKQIRV